VSAGLLTRSFYQMTHDNPGFDSHNVFTAGIRGAGTEQTGLSFTPKQFRVCGKFLESNLPRW